jgi:protein TilB
MVRISEELIVRRSEHNDGIVHSLKEITLHQFDIEKIELIGQLCRHLEILYLQSNLIRRIENLHRLKELKYLNLALNNIEKIEGLDRCESLEKLDLTVNFIDMDTFEESLLHLKLVTSLKELYLVGNPCTAFAEYRYFVAGMIPQLQRLDGQEFNKSDRIIAWQKLPEILKKSRIEAKKVRSEKHHRKLCGEPINTMEHSPEARLKTYEEACAKQKQDELQAQEAVHFQPPPDLVKEAQRKMAEKAHEAEDGTLPRQRNQSKLDFLVEEVDAGKRVRVVIDVPQYMDTSLLDIQIHPKWFQVCMKKQQSILLHFPCEINSDSAKVRRILSTGQLELLMPVANDVARSTANKKGEQSPHDDDDDDTAVAVVVGDDGDDGRSED